MLAIAAIHVHVLPSWTLYRVVHLSFVAACAQSSVIRLCSYEHAACVRMTDGDHANQCRIMHVMLSMSSNGACARSCVRMPQYKEQTLNQPIVCTYAVDQRHQV